MSGHKFTHMTGRISCTFGTMHDAARCHLPAPQIDEESTEEEECEIDELDEHVQNCIRIHVT